MRVKADIKLESEPYSDMFAPIDLSPTIPNRGDALILADVPCVCVRRQFEYDASGRLRAVTVFVQRA